MERKVNTAATAPAGLKKWIGEKFRKLERCSELNHYRADWIYHFGMARHRGRMTNLNLDRRCRLRIIIPCGSRRT